MKYIYIIFDYNNGETRFYPDGNMTAWESAWHINSSEGQTDDPVDRRFLIKSKGKIGIINYHSRLPLAVMQTMLFNSYPDHIGSIVNLAGLMNATTATMTGDISKCVGHINYSIVPRYRFLEIRKVNKDNSAGYRFTQNIGNALIDIYWDIECSKENEEVLDYLGVRREWVRPFPKKLQEPQAGTHTHREEDRELSDSETYTVHSAEEKTVWNLSALDELRRQYIQRVGDLNTSLLPKVKVAGITYKNLPVFIKDKFIRQNRDVSEGNSFAIIDGGMGSGKTYSLYETARQLSDCGHKVIALDMSDIYSETGSGSLIGQICLYTNDNEKEDNELRLRNLLAYEPQTARSDEKIIIIIDGIDEVSSLKYRAFVNELNKIARISNPDVLFILGTRNADDFLTNSGLTEGRSVFKRWDNISMLDIDCDDPMFRKEEKLKSIMENNKIFRTPLFVSYYREIQAMAEGVKSDGRSFLGSYGQGIDINKISSFHTYYDLFSVRTELLCAHARKNNINPAWYSAVLPCLAYYLHISGKKLFIYKDIEKLFDTYGCGREFDWFNTAFREEYGSFRNLFPDEKLSQLLGTRIVKSLPGRKNVYRFVHEEYMYFLAALFASRVIRGTDDAAVRQAVIDNINEKTSHYATDRQGKMLYIPFARYTFIDVVKNKPLISKAITGSRRGRKPKDSYDNFDPALYHIAANVAYEDKDVYNEATKMTKEFFKYQNQRHTSRSTTTIKDEFEDWKLINDVNVIDYSIITRRNKDPEKWNILGNIEEDLRKCATVVLRDAFEMLEYAKDSAAFSRRGFAKHFPLDEDTLLTYVEELGELINNRKTPVTNLGRFPVDLLGRLISNIGAVRQEKAKFLHNADEKKLADYIETNVTRSDAIFDNLSKAVRFHEHALHFREVVIDKIDEYIQAAKSFDREQLEREKAYLQELERTRKDISVIRSLITLGTDNYYYGDYTEDYEAARSLLDDAVNTYHNCALERQGIDPLSDLSYYGGFPVERTHEIKEIPHVGAEPFVIFRRAAGAYHLLYNKTIHAIKDKESHGDSKSVPELRKYAENLIRLQFIYLKATYIYLFETCYYLDNEDNQYKPDRIRLEINAKEIDGMWTDARDKYSKTIYDYEEYGLNEGEDLLRRIQNMYRELHPLSNDTISFAKEVQ